MTTGFALQKVGEAQRRFAMSNAPLMPKATAVWLVDNTALSFDQVADFTKMHPLEIRAIADGDAAQGIKGMDPISNGQLTREEIEKGENDPDLIAPRRWAGNGRNREFRIRTFEIRTWDCFRALSRPFSKPLRRGPRTAYIGLNSRHR